MNTLRVPTNTTKTTSFAVSGFSGCERCESNISQNIISWLEEDEREVNEL